MNRTDDKTRAWSKTKVAFFSIFSTLIVLAVLLIAMEVSARLYIYVKYGVPGKVYGLWRYDEVLGAQHRENAYNTNSQTNNYGFRINSRPEDVLEPKPQGALRIIAYGGSTTFCYNLSNEDTWPAKLEVLLHKNRNSKDQVLNAGAILWSIGHAFARAQKDIPLLKPDYVILYSGINETTNSGFLAREGFPMKSLVENGQYGKFAKNLDQNRWLKRNSAFIRLLDYYIKPKLGNAKSVSNEGNNEDINKKVLIEPDPYILKNYLHVLEQFILLIKRNDAVPVFVIEAYGKETGLLKNLTSYSRDGAETAERLGAIVIDAQTVVTNYEGPSTELFSDTGVHYSKKGAEMLANLIFETVFQHQYNINDRLQ